VNGLQLPAGIQLPELAGTQAIAFLLVLARIGPLFLLAPVLSSPLLPGRAKSIAALGMALALTPVASHGVTIPTEPFGLSTTLAQEFGVGIAFALSLAVLTAAVQLGASILDTLVGFSFGSLVDPMTGNNAAVLGRLYLIFTTRVFVVGGGVQLMVLGIARSYDLVPLGTFPPPSALGKLAVDGLAMLPVIGIELVGPVILAVVVADSAFGLVSRAVPQMNVFVLGLPAKVILSFAVVAGTLPFVNSQLQGDLQQSIADALHALGG
jgi:flagellar biosynthetic protein FliR